MAALVQTYTQQTGTATMLQTRQSSTTSGMMPVNQSNANHQYMGVPSQAPRGSYHGVNAGTGYRGSTVPIQPYAFTNPPNMNQGMQWQPYGAYRANSSPTVPTAQNFDQNMQQRSHRVNPSATNMVLNPSFGANHGGSRDDSALIQSRSLTPSPRNQPSNMPVSSQSTASTVPTKNAPDRYRARPVSQVLQHGRSQSSTLPTNLANNGQIYHAPNGSRSVPNLSAAYGAGPGSSMDDMHGYRRSSPDQTNRTRRRSVHSMETQNSLRVVPNQPAVGGKKIDNAEKSPRLGAGARRHSRNGSSDSASSNRSNPSRPSSATNRSVSVPTGNPSSNSSDESSKNDQPKGLSVPARGSSSDVSKRTLTPSPLSKPATMANDSTENSSSSPARVGKPSGNLDTPAAKQLAAISQKGGKGRSKTSRLRRAFSFGSAAEFRQAAGADGDDTEKDEPSKLHKNQSPEEVYDAEQARIAEAQEAAGIGNSIYGGRFFGSTDNLSISSTASSASIMIRKMGRGMKKSTRSLVGLFRPKSVIGVPAADSAVPEASQATVSMITVEAETQRTKGKADPEPANGSSDSPRLELISLDAVPLPDLVSERLGSSGTDTSVPRKSIVGGDKERAEVLAAVRKGILKRSSSPSIRPAESPDLMLPSVPAIADSPNSSAPSTPNDETHGHRRTGSIALGNEDYFMSALRLRQDSKSRPETPQGGLKRNATFSPRIIFYDTWPSQEYDRRGEVATCNRLTPMLAQQIKEELNSFKMEMEVHENSKIYTHFF